MSPNSRPSLLYDLRRWRSSSADVRQYIFILTLSMSSSARFKMIVLDLISDLQRLMCMSRDGRWHMQGIRPSTRLDC